MKRQLSSEDLPVAKRAKVEADDSPSSTQVLARKMRVLAKRGNAGELSLLLESPSASGLDVDDTAEGWTALMAACIGGHKEAATVLIRHRADVNKGNNDGKTALHIAAENDHADCCELLLTHGALLGPTPDRKETPLLLAASSRSVHAARTLVRHMKHMQVAQGQLPRGLTDADAKGRTALHSAAEKGCGDIVHVLLDSGMPPNVRDEKSKTPLHGAVYRGHVEIVKALVDYKADKEAKDSCGRTPLIVAAYFGRVPVMDLLLERGCQLNLSDEKGYTALHWACRQENEAAIESLLKSGANPMAVTHKNETPAQLSKNSKVNLLLQVARREGPAALSPQKSPFVLHGDDDGNGLPSLDGDGNRSAESLLEQLEVVANPLPKSKAAPASPAKRGARTTSTSPRVRPASPSPRSLVKRTGGDCVGERARANDGAPMVADQGSRGARTPLKETAPVPAHREDGAAYRSPALPQKPLPVTDNYTSPAVPQPASPPSVNRTLFATGAKNSSPKPTRGSGLSAILECLGLGDYLPHFSKEAIDEEAFVMLDEADLRELKIPMGPRKKMIQLIQSLKR